ncbi:MAG TPA: hypothetical protein VF600_18295 [Abditibacteriaceae bacterium]
MARDKPPEESLLVLVLPSGKGGIILSVAQETGVPVKESARVG